MRRAAKQIPRSDLSMPVSPVLMLWTAPCTGAEAHIEMHVRIADPDPCLRPPLPGHYKTKLLFRERLDLNPECCASPKKTTRGGAAGPPRRTDRYPLTDEKKYDEQVPCYSCARSCRACRDAGIRRGREIRDRRDYHRRHSARGPRTPADLPCPCAVLSRPDRRL